MSDGNLQEWEEYDARMLEDSPVGRGTLPNQQSGREFLQGLVESPGNLEGPFLLSNPGEIASEMLNSSVGRGGVNRPDDIRLVQRLINSHLPVRQGPLSEDGICGPRTIFAIETYQKSILRMNPPDGRIDPGGPTFRSLTGGGAAARPAIASASAAASQAAGIPSVASPSNMREAAWGYLLQFTKKHEGAVFHMYNNRTADSTTQDVTCGVGFRLDPRGAATQSWVKAMFFDPTTNQTPSDDQLLADWDAAANLARTGTNLPQYASVCRMRMYPDPVYNHMALILRDQKLPALLKSFPDDFKDFSNFPAAAQVFCVSFAYGRIPFDYPTMRAAIRDGRWADASKECYLRGGSILKNKAHADLLLLAQRVVDQNLDRDTLPLLASEEVPECETQMELQSEAMSGADRQERLMDETEGNGQRMDSHEFDPYAQIRPALRPEHASLNEGELTVIVGRQPALIALHRMLASPEPQLAVLAVLLGKVGRRSMRLNGSNVPVHAYFRLLSRLCHEAAEQTEAEAGPSIAAHAGSIEHEVKTSELESPYELPVEGEIDGTKLNWPGATQDQLNFMRAVYARHVENAQARRTFIADIAAGALAPVENQQRLRTEAANNCVTLLADARAALATAQNAGDSTAREINRINVVSGYRSASQQFTIWQDNFPKYYSQTATHRLSLSTGAHGTEAISYQASYVGNRVAAPGFSNHNDGRAVDLGADLTRNRQLTADSGDASIRLWRSSWLFQWLSNHSMDYGFFQNTSINEPWHWEYRGTSTVLPTQETAETPVSAPYVLRAGNMYISNTALLSTHRGTQPDLCVCWNDMSGFPSSVDVVVHLHGHSSERDRMLLSKKVAASGLDFSDPSGSSQGRRRKSVGIIPRGNYAPRIATPKTNANPDVYDFPALAGSSAMKDLIKYGLGRFASWIGTGSSISQGRLILTCHSGGGDSLHAILRNIDPDEIHLFDAIYLLPAELLDWIDRHVAADDAGTAGASAFRMFHTLGTSTLGNKIAVHLRDRLRKANGTRALSPYFKVELTTVAHSDIPRMYGWELLVDASTVVPKTTQISPP
jgi:LAS superfamily LD-carboxypeptidase LdcB